MKITTTAKKWYKKVDITIEDGNTKIECSANDKNELIELRTQIERVLEDIDYVLECIELDSIK